MLNNIALLSQSQAVDQSDIEVGQQKHHRWTRPAVAPLESGGAALVGPQSGRTERTGTGDWYKRLHLGPHNRQNRKRKDFTKCQT